MHSYIFITGSHPEISLAELLNASVVPSFEIKKRFRDGLLLEFDQPLKDPQALLDTLGGTIKIVAFKAKKTRGELPEICLDLIQEKYDHCQKKVRFGVSCYSVAKFSSQDFARKLKKQLKTTDISSRFIQSKTPVLNTGTVGREKLLREDGLEIVALQDKDLFWIGETVAAQDVDAYSLRDFEKPHRDMIQGILPPKLAQILLNLTGLKSDTTIWDPFCGSGVVLMEGVLQGYHMLGSDIRKEATSDSEENLIWFQEQTRFEGLAELFVHDARDKVPSKLHFNGIAAETYLGPPIRGSIDEKELPNNMKIIDDILVRFFESLKPVVHSKTPVVISFPFFRLGHRQVFLEKTLEKIKSLGYTAKCLIDRSLQKELKLAPTERNSLLYFRKDQKVGREIFRFQRKI